MQKHERCLGFKNAGSRVKDLRHPDITESCSLLCMLLLMTLIFETALECININKRALRPWVAHLRMTDQWGGTICEILVECIMRNNSVIFF